MLRKKHCCRLVHVFPAWFRFARTSMHRVAFSVVCLALLAVAVVIVGPGPISDPGHASVAGLAPPSTLDSSETDKRRKVFGAFGRLPLYFVENQGQTDHRVSHYVKGHDKTIYFTGRGLTFALTALAEKKADASAPSKSASLRRVSLGEDVDRSPRAIERWAVQLDFLGANPDVIPVGRDRASAIFSYFK